MDLQDILKPLEKEMIEAVAAGLDNEKTAIEQVTGPAVLVVVNGAVKVADGVFAQFPWGTGAIVDAALHKYVQQYEGDISKYEGAGIDDLVQLLENAAAKL